MLVAMLLLVMKADAKKGKITCEITVAAPREAVFAARSNAPFSRPASREWATLRKLTPP